MSAFSVRSGSVHELFLPEPLPVEQSIHWRSAAAHFALMGSLSVVVIQPVVQIGLQVVERLVDFFPERDLVELL